MNRRRFLTGMAGMLAAGVAPAVLPSGIIMPVKKLLVPSGMQIMHHYDGLRSCVTVVFHKWDMEFFYDNETPKPFPLAFVRPAPDAGIILFPDSDHEPR